MRPQTYRVELSEEQRVELLLLVRRGRAPARVVRRAHMLLRASEGAHDEEIAAALHVHASTVGRTRKRFSEEGLQAALCDAPRPGGTPKLDGRSEAFLIALACSDPPEGKKHWSMQMLADRMVELAVVDSLSDETVRRTLKKTRPSLG